MSTAQERAALVQSIHDLAGYVEAHPDIPVSMVSAHIRPDYGKERGQIIDLAAAGYSLAGNSSWPLVERDLGNHVRIALHVSNPAATLDARIENNQVAYSLPTAATGLRAAA